ncbi:Repressor protein C [Rhizobium sullae]|uniref:Repressor protein C n=1 Tax=Rhizobium sullae TaxID=50338 RepID=A0A2N0D2Q0_RHISU|nr:S24 family peptidase [Rhizobium sullae]PKA40413.1 Repressor protein C [Rhizobium sullae]
MSKLTEKLHEQSVATGVTQADIARELNITQQAVNNLFNGRAKSSAYWREIARMLAIEEQEMRQLMIASGRDPERNAKLPPSVTNSLKERVGVAEPPSARMAEVIPMSKPSKMIPVLGEVVGGDDGEYIFNGQVQDYIACPPSLANVANAYAVWVDGESMSPRYRPGELVYVHPARPARRGDDVVVQVHPREEGMSPLGYIKEYVGWAGNRLVLKQYNPEKKIEFDRDSVVSVHPIILSGKYS